MQWMLRSWNPSCSNKDFGPFFKNLWVLETGLLCVKCSRTLFWMEKNDKKQWPQSIRNYTSSMVGGVLEYDSVKLMRNHFFDRRFQSWSRHHWNDLLPTSGEREVAVLWYHPLRILESWKYCLHHGTPPRLYFYPLCHFCRRNLPEKSDGCNEDFQLSEAR